MSITARELAKVLGLSQTAISLALNNKPGVSAETRRLVIDEATKRGYDFGRIKGRQTKSSRIGVVIGPYFLFAKLDNTVFF